MQTFYTGTRRLILLTDEAAATLVQAEAGVPPNKAACKAQLRRVLEFLGNTDRIRNDGLFTHEEDGIYAVKARCGLRGYGWFDTLQSGESIFIVCRFIMKKRQRANRSDLDHARSERTRYRRGGEL